MNEPFRDPGHPWYYISRERGGDGQKPLTVAQIIADIVIEESPSEIDSFFACYPIKQKGKDSLENRIKAADEEFERDKKRYQELVKNGIKAVSDFDIKVCNNGDEEMALATSLFLRHNHVAYSYRKLLTFKSLRKGGIQQTFDFFA